MSRNNEDLENHMVIEPTNKIKKPIYICPECGEDIYVSEEVFDVNENLYCKDCMSSFGYFYSDEEYSLSQNIKCNDCDKEFEEEEYMYLVPKDSNYKDKTGYCTSCANNHVIDAY